MRCGSSISAWPWATTASMTVCQSQSSSSATSETVRPSRPTCTVAHLPARSVIAAAGAAIRGSVSVNVTTEQPAFGQRHRRFDHTSRVRRPKHGRSASSTSSTSWAWTPPPQPGHTGRSARVVIAIRTNRGHSPTPMTLTSGRPTSSSHMRVGSVSNRGSSIRMRKTHPESSSPCPRPGTPALPHPTPRSEAPVVVLCSDHRRWPEDLDAELTHDPSDPLVVDLEALLDQPPGDPRHP